jgi:hypothetical protein
MKMTKTPTLPVGSTAQRGEEIGVDALSKVVAAAHRAQADAWRSRPLRSAVATPSRASRALPREVEVEAPRRCRVDQGADAAHGGRQHRYRTSADQTEEQSATRHVPAVDRGRVRYERAGCSSFYAMHLSGDHPTEFSRSPFK